MRFAPRTVWSLAEAREALERLVGMSQDWGRLDEFLISYLVEPSMRATVIASSFAAVLEMVREGALEVQQDDAFAPIFLRKRGGQMTSNAMPRSGPSSTGECNGMGLAKPHIVGDEPAERVDRRRAGRMPAERPEELRLIEALLFAAGEPLDDKTLRERLPEGVDIASAMRRLQAEYAPRGVNLVRVAGKWMFRTANDLAWLLARDTVEPKKLSRAANETLAIIAYHQPVTRAEIEDIRGVSVSKGTVDVLLETGWIRPRGRRKAPGRPLTFGTTRSLPGAFRPRGDRRPAGPRRAEGNRPARRPPAGRLLGAAAVRRCGAARGRGPARAGRSRSRPRAAARRPRSRCAHARPRRSRRG